MNRVTFNYASVYVCICDAQHSSVTVHRERFQENRKFLTECGVTIVFVYAKCKIRRHFLVKIPFFQATRRQIIKPVRFCLKLDLRTVVSYLFYFLSRFWHFHFDVFSQGKFAPPYPIHKSSGGACDTSLHWGKLLLQDYRFLSHCPSYPVTETANPAYTTSPCSTRLRLSRLASSPLPENSFECSEGREFTMCMKFEA